MYRLKENDSSKVTKQMWSLANSSKLLVKEYSVYMVNVVRFHTKDLDNCCVTQNSGVSTEGDHDGQIQDFYGHVCKIWELEYMYQYKVVLFKCEWYNTGNKTCRRRTIRTETHCTSINV